jgi:hypothetical protein
MTSVALAATACLRGYLAAVTNLLISERWRAARRVGTNNLMVQPWRTLISRGGCCIAANRAQYTGTLWAVKIAESPSLSE